MRLFYQPQIDVGDKYLDAEESRHCVKVLRLKKGDPINVVNGKGILYKCILTSTDPRKCVFEVIEKQLEPPKNYFIHIVIAPTKNFDRLEWFVEKSVELGIDRVTPVLCRHSERKTLRTDRLKRKAVSAMKQSLKFSVPEISELTPLIDLLDSQAEDERFIAYVDNLPRPHLITRAKKGRRYSVLIGPEGDFTSEEIANAIDHGYEPVSLGASRLRTETAGVVACHVLNLVNGGFTMENGQLTIDN